ncbi:type IV pilin N-terminal domain-containing protein [Methanosarcina sp. UBA5]|uniref:type IV pilin N-terminal domain-containing protein n=1 Tax=Methanosarcina sp. UBA5 TaxID=1915593 RepID=UPI0025EEA8AB|nr:type IV pilin N-terminal domain-containing protein [Methanosarcina sp. UBA5]
MDFKKLFRKDDKAVSPVIGVILMVAITVILAAAIGSSVFSHGVSKSAPQANLNLQAAGIITSGSGETATSTGCVKIEHVGGDSINFADTATKVTASVNGTSTTTNATNIGVMNVGDIKILGVDDVNEDSTVELKFIDTTSNQLLLDKVLNY